MNVICKGCGICCRKHWLIKLNDKEKELFNDILVFGNYFWANECKYYINNKCEIYEQRPNKCKDYFCEKYFNMEKVTSKMCMKKDIGMNGNLFGGNMLAWLDEAAAIYAHKTTNEPLMVTLKFGELLFKKPVKCGDIVDFYCDNAVIGNTSISFDIYAKINDDIVFNTNAVFVAVDENSKRKTINKK